MERVSKQAREREKGEKETELVEVIHNNSRDVDKLDDYAVCWMSQIFARNILYTYTELDFGP